VSLPLPDWYLRARDVWLPRRAEPLTLRAILAGPVCVDVVDGLAVEGALQHAIVAAVTGQMPYEVMKTLPEATCDAMDLPVPIADVTMHDRLIACASLGRFAPGAIEGTRWMRRQPVYEALGMKTVPNSGGPYKLLNTPMATVIAAWVEFDAVGDPDLLRAVLDQVRCLGRGRSSLGGIDGWTIREASVDGSLVRDGMPARPLPVTDDAEAAGRFSRGYDLRVCATRAPYWHRRSRTLCACPVPQMLTQAAS
jgi:hypothetical protein